MPSQPSHAAAAAAPGQSYEYTASRFDQAAAAAHYATKHGGHARDRREQSCIQRALAGLPRGARVLDLPSGAGRLIPMLLRLGFVVTEADYSPHMVDQARKLFADFAAANPAAAGSPVTFETQDVMRTTYPDGAFDAAVCNRLFHHFSESDTRVKALRELRRITNGPIVVSFFNADTIDARFKRLVNALRGKTLKGRIPIPLATFAADARSAGLKPDATFPTRGPLSPQTYVRLTRA